MHSYYDFNFVSRQPVKIITRLLYKAHEKQEKQQAWEIWLTKYPNMTENDYVSFNEFWKKLKSPKIEESNESVQETFNRFKKVLKKEQTNEDN